jgi:hypothetical protein
MVCFAQSGYEPAAPAPTSCRPLQDSAEGAWANARTLPGARRAMVDAYQQRQQAQADARSQQQAAATEWQRQHQQQQDRQTAQQQQIASPRTVREGI